MSDEIDFNSPYYIHPSHHPNLSICPISLNGDNYEQWSIAMRNSFRALRKLGFIDGTIPKPAAGTPELDDWLTVNSIMVEWVFNSIEPTLKPSITYFDAVKELWDDIRQRFSVDQSQRKFELRSEIARCRQSGQRVAAYYGVLKKLWGELSACAPPRGCTCGKCECNLDLFLKKEREEERVIQFLMGLDDGRFGPFRSIILAQYPLPELDLVYAVAIQIELFESARVSDAPVNRETVMCIHCAEERRRP